MEVQLTAREMFEKLGYKQKVQDDYIEYYVDGIDYPFGYYPYILFDLKNKCWNSNLEGTSDEEELAIRQQVKELNWDNE